MAILLVVCLPLIGLLLLIRKAVRDRKTAESQLTIFEHPATFERPGIEMVSVSESNQKDGQQSETPYQKS